MFPFAYDLLETALPLVAVTVVVLVVTWRVAKRRHDAALTRRWLIRVALAMWIATLLWWTLGLSNPSESGSNRINLTPFEEIARAWESTTPGYTALNLVGNVAVFVPLGALLVLARAHRDGWPFVSWLLGTALSASIEVTQYAVGRSADVDDVILNSAGVAVGVVLAVATRRARARATQ